MNRNKKKKQFIFVDDPEAAKVRRKEEEKEEEVKNKLLREELQKKERIKKLRGEEINKSRTFFLSIKDLSNEDIRVKLTEFMYDKDSPNSRVKVIQKILDVIPPDNIKNFINDFLKQNELDYIDFTVNYIRNIKETSEYKESERKVYEIFNEVLYKKITVNATVIDINNNNEEIGEKRDVTRTFKVDFIDTNKLLSLAKDSLNSKDIEIINKIIEFDPILLKRFIKDYLDQFYETYDIHRNIVKPNVLPLSNFYYNFVNSQYYKTYLKKIEIQKQRESEKADKFKLKPVILTYDEKIKNILSKPINRNVVDLGKKILSESLIKVTNNIYSYRIDSPFIVEIIEVIQNSSNNIQEFATKLGNIVIFLKPNFGKISNDIFISRIKDFYYKPDALPNLTISDKLPQVYDSSIVILDKKEDIIKIFDKLLENFVKNFAQKIYADNNNMVYNFIELNVEFPEIFTEFKQNCVNYDKIKDIPDKDLIFYVDNGRKYCLDIKEINKLIQQNNNINPYTNNVLSEEFVNKIKNTFSISYPSEEKEVIKEVELPKKEISSENIILAPNLIDYIMEDIENLEKGLPTIENENITFNDVFLQNEVKLPTILEETSNITPYESENTNLESKNLDNLESKNLDNLESKFEELEEIESNIEPLVKQKSDINLEKLLYIKDLLVNRKNTFEKFCIKNSENSRELLDLIYKFINDRRMINDFNSYYNINDFLGFKNLFLQSLGEREWSYINKFSSKYKTKIINKILNPVQMNVFINEEAGYNLILLHINFLLELINLLTDNIVSSNIYVSTFNNKIILSKTLTENLDINIEEINNLSLYDKINIFRFIIRSFNNIEDKIEYIIDNTYDFYDNTKKYRGEYINLNILYSNSKCIDKNIVFTKNTQCIDSDDFIYNFTQYFIKDFDTGDDETEDDSDADSDDETDDETDDGSDDETDDDSDDDSDDETDDGSDDETDDETDNDSEDDSDDETDDDSEDETDDDSEDETDDDSEDDNIDENIPLFNILNDKGVQNSEKIVLNIINNNLPNPLNITKIQIKNQLDAKNLKIKNFNEVVSNVMKNINNIISCIQKLSNNLNISRKDIIICTTQNECDFEDYKNIIQKYLEDNNIIIIAEEDLKEDGDGNADREDNEEDGEDNEEDGEDNEEDGEDNEDNEEDGEDDSEDNGEDNEDGEDNEEDGEDGEDNEDNEEDGEDNEDDSEDNGEEDGEDNEDDSEDGEDNEDDSEDGEDNEDNEDDSEDNEEDGEDNGEDNEDDSEDNEDNEGEDEEDGDEDNDKYNEENDDNEEDKEKQDNIKTEEILALNSKNQGNVKCVTCNNEIPIEKSLKSYEIINKKGNVIYFCSFKCFENYKMPKIKKA